MVRLDYVNPKIKKNIEKLETKDKEFFEYIKNAFRNIKEDPTCGIKISLKLIPKELKKKYKINNLYKYNLPSAWRLLYSLAGNRVEIIAIILGCFNHKEYERKFNY